MLYSVMKWLWRVYILLALLGFIAICFGHTLMCLVCWGIGGTGLCIMTLVSTFDWDEK